MKTTAEKIAVMQAYEDGKRVMCQSDIGPAFGLDLDTNPGWNWDKNDYWVKPDPAEVWVNMYRSSNPVLHTEEENSKRTFCGSIDAGDRCAVHFREVIE